MPIGNRPIKSISESVDNDEYRQKFREKVFKLVKMGYDLLDSKEYKDSDEPDISGELAKKMRGITEESTGPQWATHFAIHDDPPVNDPNRFGKNRRRLDIEIERTCHGPHPRYSFEAKRLSGNSFTAGKYFGEGLMRFVLGNYAYGQNEAGMLGYVQSDTMESWAVKLEKQFEKDRTSIHVYPDEKWLPVKIVSELNHCYCSKHQRPSIGKPITMYHLLLSFY